MKQFTQEQAINEVFNSKSLSAKMITYRHRYKKGKLSQKAIEDILKNNNFVVVQESLYSKEMI